MPRENQIRREDLAYRIAKALEIKGVMPDLNLDPTVLGVVILEDLSAGNEQDYAVNRWCRGRGTTPAGAQFGKLSFNNHADSGILVKVYSVDIWAGGVAAAPPAPGAEGFEIGMSIEGSSLGGTQLNFTKIFTDSRLSFGAGGGAQPARLPSVDIRHDNSGGIGTHGWRGFVPVTGYHVDMGGYVLRPGTRLHFESVELALPYTVAAEWTETNV